MNNIPEYSVKQLNIKIKNTLEENFEYVCVKGESGQITVAKSGHAYFSIKENDEVISCICWKGNLDNLNIKIEEGVEYNFYGRITSYAKFGRSTYQLIIDQVEFSGEGTILKLIEERKKKYERLGYFDVEKKLKIPIYPETIYIITSPTGAVIRDIIQRINSRYPLVELFVCPITVQGKNAHKEIIEYLDLIMNEEGMSKPSLIIFARGGGSLEEMMPFNESELIEKVYSLDIPNISAIGHETDYTLLDYVSDLRAPTPTAAAEMSTPDKKEINNSLIMVKSNLIKVIKLIYKNYYYRIKQFNNGLSSSINKNFIQRERINLLMNNHFNSFSKIIEFKKEKIQKLFEKINQNNPNIKLSNKINYIESYSLNMSKVIKSKIKINNQKINFNERLINNSSIDKNLKKGYALIFNKKKIIKTKNELNKIKEFKIKFKDETILIKKN